MAVILKVKVKDIASLVPSDEDDESARSFCNSVKAHNDEGELILVFKPYDIEMNEEGTEDYISGTVRLKGIEVSTTS